MDNGYVLLAQKEEIWARMLIQVLEDNRIPCVPVPVFGAGFSLRTGTQEQLKVYVPSGHFSQASELLQALFDGQIPEEENPETDE